MNSNLSESLSTTKGFRELNNKDWELRRMNINERSGKINHFSRQSCHCFAHLRGAVAFTFSLVPCGV